MAAEASGELLFMDLFAVNVDEMGSVTGEGAEEGVAAEGAVFVDPFQTHPTPFQGILLHVVINCVGIAEMLELHCGCGGAGVW
jgi:hypothetical protein